MTKSDTAFSKLDGKFFLNIKHVRDYKRRESLAWYFTDCFCKTTFLTASQLRPKVCKNQHLAKLTYLKFLFKLFAGY